MILKELYSLYERLLKQGVSLPRMGYCMQKISYRVIITHDGTLVRIEDAREVETKAKKGNKEAKKLVMREMLVPGSPKPSGAGVNPCFLCDNPAYLLGCVAAKERAKEYFEKTREMHLAIEKEINSPAYSAVCRFFESWNPDKCSDIVFDKDLYTGNGYFVIMDSLFPVHEDEKVQQWWIANGYKRWRAKEGDDSGALNHMCLVSGEYAKTAILHEPAIKGVFNSQSMGAKLVSFNCKSFESYGKEQSVNSPVSEKIANGYCNALNYLLGRSESRVKIGDATTVFWTDAPASSYNDIEILLGGCIDPQRLDAQDDVLVSRLRKTLLNIVNGDLPDDVLQSNTKFYILGLSPNAARLSVRFFSEGPLHELFQNIRSHYDALSLHRRNEKIRDLNVIAPYMLLRQTARDVDDIAPLLGGALMKAILFKLPYPDAIATAILRRFRADNEVNYIRCAYLKAWLIRKNSNYQIKPMLDEENKHPGYVLGRLFALLQKTQTDGHPNLNRTIQDAYYSSASSTPGAVFPRLLKLYRHHIAKVDNVGRRIIREKQVQHVMSMLERFPSRLSVEQQGFFALGFYQQTQFLFEIYTNNN